jgi:hypothetical protein
VLEPCSTLCSLLFGGGTLCHKVALG